MQNLNSEENENHSRMYVPVIIKSEQYTDINLNAEHGMLGPGSHKNLHEMFSDANHVNRKTMTLLREGIHAEKRHRLKSGKGKLRRNLPLRAVSTLNITQNRKIEPLLK